MAQTPEKNRSPAALQRAVVEEVVLVSAWGGHALDAADKQKAYAQRNQNGKTVSVGFKPLN